MAAMANGASLQTQLAAAIFACCLALVLPTLAAGAPPSKSEGTPIVVTPEMRGAGAVSSGVKLPPPPPATGTWQAPVPSWGKPLPYPIIIADRRNNRLIEVAPNKQIVWEYPSPNLKIYRGNDDVYFSPDGNRLMVNEEDNYDIHIIDYASRQMTWMYGVSDAKGTAEGYFDFPDDAHLLPNGNVVVADIRNCRIQFIDPNSNHVFRQWGHNRICKHDPPGYFALPNGIALYPNGDILITEITGSWVTRMTEGGNVVWSTRAPHTRYPSDAFPARNEQVIVADYAKPGRVVIFDPKSDKLTWEYAARRGEAMLDHPSLALELPNGDVVLNDDFRHRVVVIDRQSKQIIWQYGITDHPGHAPGYLFHPDGLDIDVYHDWKAALANQH